MLETRGFEKAGDPAQAFWGTPAITVADARRPLVVVYLVDTLRADHTGLYGYARDTTPELDAFAQDAVVFDAAVASASWTKPSVASILTSRLPGPAPRGAAPRRLDRRRSRSPRCCRRKGFATAPPSPTRSSTARSPNFEQGFDYFAGLHGEEGPRSKLVDAGVVVDQALAFLDAAARPADLPLRPHHGPARALHAARALRPPVRAAPDARATPAQDPRTDYQEPLDRERLIAQYDGDIAYGDREFGRFLRELKARGLYDDALVVFLADHGEEFLDHGQWLHGRSVFDELVRVPLLVKLPGQRGAGTRVARAGAGGGRAAHRPRGDRPAAARRTSSGRPLQRALERGRARAAGARRDQPPRLRGPRRAHERGQVHPPLQPARRRAATSTWCATRGSRRASRPRTPTRVRLRKARVEAGMAQNPFRYVLQPAAPSRLQPAARDARLARSHRGHRPRARRSARVVGGNGRTVDLLLQPREGAPREIAFTVRPDRRAGRAVGHARRPAAAAAGRRLGEGGHHPEALPYRCRTSSRRPSATAGCACSRPRLEPLRRFACGWCCRRAGRSASWTRRRASGCGRSATWARASWPGSSSSTSTAPSWIPRATSRPRSTRPCSGSRPGSRRSPLDRILAFVGEGARLLVERWLAAAGLDCRSKRCCPSTWTATASGCSTRPASTPGVGERWRPSARRTPLAVLTNKPGDMSRTILAGLGVADRFARIWGAGDVPARKPDPRACWTCWPSSGSPRPDAWMVGDSATDVATGRAAGVRVGGSPGASTRGRSRAAGPDPVLERPGELVRAAAAVRPQAARCATASAASSGLPPMAHNLLLWGDTPCHPGRGSARRGISGRTWSRSLASARGRARRPAPRSSWPTLTIAAQREASGPGCAPAAGSRPSWWRWRKRPTATRCCAASPSSTTCWCGRSRPPPAAAASSGPSRPSHNRRVGPPARDAPHPQGRGAHRAEQDRGGALGRARHRQAARADPAQEPRDHGAPTRGACTWWSAARTKSRTDDQLRFKLTQNDTLVVPFEETTMPLDETSIAGYVALTGRRVNVADAYNLPAGLALPHQPLLGRAVGLPHQVDAGRAHARPQGRGHRGGAAHQQEARRGGRAAPGGGGGRGGHPLHRGGRGARRPRWPARPRWPSRTPS